LHSVESSRKLHTTSHVFYILTKIGCHRHGGYTFEFL